MRWIWRKYDISYDNNDEVTILLLVHIFSLGMGGWLHGIIENIDCNNYGGGQTQDTAIYLITLECGDTEIQTNEHITSIGAWLQSHLAA